MAGGRGDTFAARIIERALELRKSDAFAPATRADIAVSAREAREEMRADTRRARRIIGIFAAVSVAVALFSLLLPYWGLQTMGAGGEVCSPSLVFDCYSLWFQVNVVPIFDQSVSASELLADFGEAHSLALYHLITDRAAVTIIVVLSGVMLAVAGLLFQTAFRNPLAAPTALGVSDGVTLGCIIFAMLGNASINADAPLYLALVYGFGALAVIVVLLLSRGLTGGSRYNVLDMLLLGTVICQLLGGVNGYIQNFVMDDSSWYLFYEIQQSGDALTSPVIRWAAFAAFVATFLPALLLRYKLNLIAFSDDDGRMMGVRAGLLRGGALVLGSVMQLAAIASIGQVAMLSIAVPFVVRYMLPADFRWQFLGNCLVGVTVLLVCVCAQHFAVIGFLTVPVGTIVSVLIVPFFVWMIAIGKGRW